MSSVVVATSNASASAFDRSMLLSSHCLRAGGKRKEKKDVFTRRDESFVGLGLTSLKRRVNTKSEKHVVMHLHHSNFEACVVLLKNSLSLQYRLSSSPQLTQPLFLPQQKRRLRRTECK
jgi:hypothetical protein